MILFLDTWTKKANFPGVFRHDQVGFSLNGKGYMGLGYYDSFINGQNKSVFCNDIWEYDPLNNIWLKKANYPGVERYGRIAGAANGKAFVGGGDKVYMQTTTSQFWQFDPLANTWVRKKDFFDVTRYDMASFTISERLFAGLGTGGTSVSDLWEYDAIHDTWVEKRALIMNMQLAVLLLLTLGMFW
jgi:N-acetylneuraminic acid mutarotase